MEVHTYLDNASNALRCTSAYPGQLQKRARRSTRHQVVDLSNDFLTEADLSNSQQATSTYTSDISMQRTNSQQATGTDTSNIPMPREKLYICPEFSVDCADKLLNLPDDLMYEVLMRIPPSEMSRMGSLNKSWNSELHRLKRDGYFPDRQTKDPTQ